MYIFNYKCMYIYIYMDMDIYIYIWIWIYTYSLRPNCDLTIMMANQRFYPNIALFQVSELV